MRDYMVEENHSQGRLSWVDNVKMLAMLFVILGHTWRIIHCPLPDWLNLFILSFNMPLFVIMTGYTSVNAISRINSKESLGEYIIKITNRILVPSAVFGSIMEVFFQISKFLITKEIEIPLLIYRIVFVVLFIIAFILRSNVKWVKMYSLMTIVAIPTAIFASPFWFFSMIWCVCVSVAVAALIVNSINWGGGFVVVFDSVCYFPCD